MFQYSIDDCDVSDRASLGAFRGQLEHWNVLFNRDERNSIVNQMGDMLCQDAAWRCANEARRFAKEDGPNASIAPLIAMMLDRGYVSGQVIAIAKLLEASPTNQPKKAVVSLRRLTDEVREARSLITRENFVSQDALPYDCEVVEARELSLIAAKTDKSRVYFTSMPTAGPEAWAMAAQQHEFFDRLSGVPADRRDRRDLIDVAFFDRLDASLQDPLLDEIRTLRHKSVAHAADAGSREAVANLRNGVTLADFDRAHYLLSGVYQALSVTLFGQWRGGGVPVPQHDLFLYCDQPFIASAHVGEIQEFWKKHSNERERFLRDAYNEILPGKTEE